MATITDVFRADAEESRKMETNYSDVCDEKIPKFKEMADNGKFIEAIDGLLSLEKQTRTVRVILIECKVLSFPCMHSIILEYLLFQEFRYGVHGSSSRCYCSDML